MLEIVSGIDFYFCKNFLFCHGLCISLLKKQGFCDTIMKNVGYCQPLD